jgi:hypothetical protein
VCVCARGVCVCGVCAWGVCVRAHVVCVCVRERERSVALGTLPERLNIFISETFVQCVQKVAL